MSPIRLNVPLQGQVKSPDEEKVNEKLEALVTIGKIALVTLGFLSGYYLLSQFKNLRHFAQLPKLLPMDVPAKDIPSEGVLPALSLFCSSAAILACYFFDQLRKQEFPLKKKKEKKIDQNGDTGNSHRGDSSGQDGGKLNPQAMSTQSSRQRSYTEGRNNKRPLDLALVRKVTSDSSIGSNLNAEKIQKGINLGKIRELNKEAQKNYRFTDRGLSSYSVLSSSRAFSPLSEQIDYEKLIEKGERIKVIDAKHSPGFEVTEDWISIPIQVPLSIFTFTLLKDYLIVCEKVRKKEEDIQIHLIDLGHFNLKQSDTIADLPNVFITSNHLYIPRNSRQNFFLPPLEEFQEYSKHSKGTLILKCQDKCYIVTFSEHGKPLLANGEGKPCHEIKKGEYREFTSIRDLANFFKDFIFEGAEYCEYRIVNETREELENEGMGIFLPAERYFLAQASEES